MNTTNGTPQDKGREWERIWAEKVGGRLVPGSGNQFHSKLDVRGSRITWSCKWTSSKSFSVTRQILDEARDGTIAPGGNATIGALSIRIEEVGDFVVIQAEDFLELLKSKPVIQADKADNRRATAAIPQLLRENDGN